MNISRERCFNHGDREAVAQCPQCRRFFCRECVTEHGDRVICAFCLRAMQSGRAEKNAVFLRFLTACQAVAGLMFLWFFFYCLARVLLLLPSSFHEGSMWRALPWNPF